MESASTLPPDRGHIQTEHRHHRSTNLDELDTHSFIQLMADDHRIVSDAVLQAGEPLTALIDSVVARMRRGGRLIYIGAGTSGRLGVLDASECPPTFQSDPHQVVGIIAGGDESLRKSSEGMEDDFNGAATALAALEVNSNDTVLGIAAGGTTPYVLGALRIAKTAGAATGLLTCAGTDSAPAHCDHVIVLNTGPEVLTGSTRLKAGSATKLALNIISTAAFIQLGKVYSNLMVDLKATNTKLMDRAIRIMTELCPDLERAGAADLLRKSQGQLKAAIVSHKRGITIEMAQSKLAEVNHSLRRALEQ